MAIYKFEGYFEAEPDLDTGDMAMKIEDLIPFHVDGLDVTQVED